MLASVYGIWRPCRLQGISQSCEREYPLKVEALVIGAGPGGYVAGIRLGQLGIQTMVVEKANPGGVCLNVGCIPSKALITAAKTYAKAKHGTEFGLTAENVTLDMNKLQDWKSGVVSKLTGGVKTLLKANKVDYRTGEARFVAKDRVEVRSEEGDFTVEAKHVVIATGSTPIEIPGFKFDGNNVVDSTGALAFTEVPDRLVIIGGGYIGMEIGTLYGKLGSKVTVVEAGPGILAGSDPDLGKVVAKKLQKSDISVHTNAKAKGFVPAADGKGGVVTIETASGDLEIPTDKVLVAVGRRPNSANLGLEAIDIAPDAKGFLTVNKRQETSVSGVYAIGDVAGQPMLAHKGSKEGEVVAEVIAGKPAEMDARVIPAVIFTDPEIASAGLSETEAKDKGIKYKVGKFPFAALGRAIANADTDGYVKVLMDTETTEILGIHAVGGGASDIIGEAALAIEMGAMAADLGLTVHAHPTLPEAIMEAAKAAEGEAIHIMNR